MLWPLTVPARDVLGFQPGSCCSTTRDKGREYPATKCDDTGTGGKFCRHSFCNIFMCVQTSPTTS